MLIILRPGFTELTPAMALPIVAALFMACAIMLVKTLSRSEAPFTMVLYMNLILTPLSLIPALFVWRWPSLTELAWLAAIGVIGSCGHLCFVKAYTFADVSAVEPITFTRLIWAALIGYLAFAEFPDLWVWTGGGMIVAATSYIAHREAAARRMHARQTNERPTKS